MPGARDKQEESLASVKDNNLVFYAARIDERLDPSPRGTSRHSDERVNGHSPSIAIAAGDPSPEPFDNQIRSMPS